MGRGVPAVGITTAKGTCSSANLLFDTLLRDSAVEALTGVLGRIAGQALLDAMERNTSCKIDDLLTRPILLDKALVTHLGLAAKVLERKVLRVLTKKAVAGIAPGEKDWFDFAQEVEKVRKDFLKRKEGNNQPQLLE
jgi:hypothetical protein